LATAQGSGDLNEALGAVIRTSPQKSLSLIKRERVTRDAQPATFVAADGVERGMRARTACRLYIGAGDLSAGVF
jgi:hypothetical protein